MSDLKMFSRSEVSKHNKDKDAWVIISGNVYDISKFAILHPGGERLLLEYAGQDCTDDFFGNHRAEILDKYGNKLLIGKVQNEDSGIVGSSSNLLSTIPYSEPGFFRGEFSPYYNESHKKLKRFMREFISAHVKEIAEKCEQEGTPPPADLFLKLGAEGIFAAWIGPKPGEHLKFVDKLPGGISPSDMCYFSEAIIHQEFARLITPGFEDGLVGGRNISVPPLLWFGTDRMKHEIVPQILRGEKHSALAITEPFAGSDVRGIRCRAEKTPDGKYYIVNGVKKFITEGHNGDYFITLCNTGKSQSMLLIEKGKGVETKLIKSVYSTSARTSYVTFEDVRVPAENLIGKEGNGFKQTAFTFNHERWMILVKQIARARVMIEECFKYAMQRKAFGKPLIQQPVIQEKLARMISRVEACDMWCENITYQMNNMSFDEQNAKLGGSIALLKFQTGELGHVVAEDAVSIFGGRAMAQTGMGKLVERYQRTYRLPGVYGGSTEIMGSLGIKQAMKNMPKGMATPKL